MSKAPPLVCVCVPTYNAESTVRETLESLLAQTYPNLVIRISDNASTDRTVEIIDSFGDPRIRVYRHEKNIGGEGNFSRCIELGTGAYTAVFHADDVYGSDMVARQVATLEAHPEIGAVFTEAVLIDERGIPNGVTARPPGGRRRFWQYKFSGLVKALLEHSNFLICPSAMVRTRIYQEEIGRWRGDQFGSSADLDVWLRIARAHSVAVLGEQLMRYRVSAGQGSTRLIRERTERGDFFRVMDHYLSLPELRETLSDEDLRHYQWLERTDRIIRAVNLYLADRVEEASTLSRGAVSMDAVRAALSTGRGLITLLGGIYLRLLLFFRCRKLGKITLQRLKRVAQK
jgi:glycosyltransferase involved in cell wall biosynthesis